MSKLKIGIDFHGTITANPNGFKKLTEGLLAIGADVHIMTGAREDKFREECSKLDIELMYTHFFSITDYYLKTIPEVVDLTDPNHPRIENKVVWDIAKGNYARKHNITVVIDNEQTYGEYFSTPFFLYKQ